VAQGSERSASQSTIPVVFFFFLLLISCCVVNVFAEPDLSQREQEAYTQEDLARIRRSARIQAEEAYQKGDYDTAILNLERILFFYPNDKEIKAEIDKIKQEKLQAVAPEEKQDLRRWVNDAQKAIQMRDIEGVAHLYYHTRLDWVSSITDYLCFLIPSP
jgi:hypothetical protein